MEGSPFSYTYINVYSLTENWQEDQITWNNQPSKDIKITSENVNEDDINSYVVFNIIDICRDWANGTKDNYGLRFCDNFHSIESTYGTFATFQFYSSEYSSEYLRPKLEIEYYMP